MRTEEQIRAMLKQDEPSLRMMNAIEKMEHQPYLYGWLEALKWVLNEENEE